jgi:hypothetical protein
MTWHPSTRRRGLHTTGTRMQASSCKHTLASRVRNSSSLMGNSRWAVTSEGVLRLCLLIITPPRATQQNTHNAYAPAPTHAPHTHDPRPVLLTCRCVSGTARWFGFACVAACVRGPRGAPAGL